MLARPVVPHSFPSVHGLLSSVYPQTGAYPNAVSQVRSFSTANARNASKLGATAPAASANLDLGMDLSMNRPRTGAWRRRTNTIAQPVAALRDASDHASIDLSFASAGSDSGANEFASLAESFFSRAGGNWELEFTTLACEQKEAQQAAQQEFLSEPSPSVRDFAFALMLARGASFSH